MEVRHELHRLKTPQGRHQPAPRRPQHGALLAAHRRPRRQAPPRLQREHRRLLAASHRRAARTSLSAGRLRRLPRIHRRQAKPSRRYFRVSPDQFLFTNGTDEAIQVFINTYVDDGDEVLVLKPAYAMYRFYAEVAGAKIVEVAYPPPAIEFPLQEVLDAITPETRAVIISNPNNPTGTGVSLLAIERILARAKKAVVMIDEAYYEFSGVTALTEIERIPTSSSAAPSPRSSAWPPCAWAASSRTRPTSSTCTRRSRPTA